MKKYEGEKVFDPLFKLAEISEKIFAYAQGKGSGTKSIRKENELVHKFLGKDVLLAIDIGGNVGEYTAEIRRRNPNAEIHIFEPSYANIKKLNKRFSGDKTIHVVPLAVSDKNGSSTLFSNEAGSGLGSLSQRRLDHFNIKFDIKEDIETIRFEEYWESKLNKRKIDFVKMDIEGHELSALNGFGESISSIRLIQFEFGGCNIDTRTYFQDFWYFFKENNFEIFRMTPFRAQHINRYKESEEYFSTTNYIALNKIFK